MGIGGASSPPFLRFTRSLRHSTVTRSAAVRKYISSPDRAGVSFEVSQPSAIMPREGAARQRRSEMIRAALIVVVIVAGLVLLFVIPFLDLP